VAQRKNGVGRNIDTNMNRKLSRDDNNVGDNKRTNYKKDMNYKMTQ